MTSERHDLILVRIADKAEENIPAGAVFTFEDLETGETIVLDNLKNAYQPNTNLGLPVRNIIHIRTDEDYVKPLKKFFRSRGRG